MSGWQYIPRFRIVPEDGPEVTYTLTNVGGGGTGAKSIRMEYVRNAVQRETPTRRLIKRDFGRRIEVTFTYELTEMTEEATFIDIFNAACRDDVVVYMSLDGGTTEMIMVPPEDGGYQWTPLARKNYIGILVEMTLMTKEVLESIRPMIGTGGVTQWA